MKYWQEYCLVKRIEKHFGKINIGDLDKINAVKHDTCALLCGLNICNFWIKLILPITKVYSSPIFHLITTVLYVAKLAYIASYVII